MKETQSLSMPLISSFSKWTTKEKYAAALLISSYIAGIIGIGVLKAEWFLLLTPFNLLLSLILMMWNHQNWTVHTFVFLILAYVVGFGAELFGVQTGILFGEYEYGPVLGYKIWGTPLMIGVNWILVAYTAGATINQFMGKSPWWLRALAGSSLLVLLDWFIEPVAMAYNFWSWEGDIVPLQNYFGWFLVALPLQAYFAYFQGNATNKVAVLLLILQFAFFIIL
jgi:putative membrane protein